MLRRQTLLYRDHVQLRLDAEPDRAAARAELIAFPDPVTLYPLDHKRNIHLGHKRTFSMRVW